MPRIRELSDTYHVTIIIIPGNGLFLRVFEFMKLFLICYKAKV